MVQGEQTAQATRPPLTVPRGTLQVLLTDAPIEGDVTSVNVCFDQASVILADDEEAPPVTVALGIGTIDLLELRDGVTALLGEADLPAGETVAEIRVVLCERGNSIVVDGEEHDLVTPSGQQSGLKLKPRGGITIREGTTSVATVDFDAAESVHFAPGRGYLLEPVIRMVEGAFVTIAAPEADTAVAPGALLVTGEAGAPTGDPLAGVTVNGVAAALIAEGYSATIPVPGDPGPFAIVAIATTASGLSASVDEEVVIASGPADDGQTEDIPAFGFDRERVQAVSIEITAAADGEFLVRATCAMCVTELTVERWTAADDPTARELAAAVVERIAGAETDSFRLAYPEASPGALIGFDAVARLVQINGGPAIYERAAMLGRISPVGEFEPLSWGEFVCAAGFATCGVDETGELQVNLHLGGTGVQP